MNTSNIYQHLEPGTLAAMHLDLTNALEMYLYNSPEYLLLQLEIDSIAAMYEDITGESIKTTF